jgi:hypothetical protein
MFSKVEKPELVEPGLVQHNEEELQKCNNQLNLGLEEVEKMQKEATVVFIGKRLTGRTCVKRERAVSLF